MKKDTGRERVFGISFPAATSPLERALWLFRYGNQLRENPGECPLKKKPKSWDDSNFYTGEGRYQHCRALIEGLLPDFEWHEFSERMIRALCENESLAACGCAGSGKSAGTGAYAFVWWLAGTKESAVLIASTTIAAALQRIWRNVSENFYSVQRRIGQIGEIVILGKPRPEIRATPKSFAEGMFVIPVAQGDIQKAVNELKGRHPKRLLLIGDETDSISPAIVEVQDNLRVGTEEFQTVWLGNLPSLFNPLGQLMEPAPNTPVSEACGMEWTSTTGVKCLRFDGEDSPNVLHNGKYKGLIRQKDLDAIISRNHGVKGQQYWIMGRGLPPPEGVDDTVLSEAMLTRFNARLGVTWARDYISFAALDPGFGGDACMLRIYRRGMDTDGSLKILFDKAIPIPIEAADATNPAEYQIAAKTKEACLLNNIPPQEFIVGSTGIGRGTAAVLQREWSPLIELCEEGGSATELPVSNEDGRPAKEVYDRRITELWFSTREFVQADMIRGMDNDTARELCSRKWEYKGSGAGKRISLEKKEDMRARGIPSPNNGDAFAQAIDLLRRKGILPEQSGTASMEPVKALEQEAAEYDFEEAYADEV